MHGRSDRRFAIRGNLAVRGDEDGGVEEPLCARLPLGHPKEHVGSMLRGDSLDRSDGRSLERFSELRERVAGHVPGEEQFPGENEIRLCPGDGFLEFLQVSCLVADGGIQLRKGNLHAAGMLRLREKPSVVDLGGIDRAMFMLVPPLARLRAPVV